MPITLNNAFKGRQHPGELIILCVRVRRQLFLCIDDNYFSPINDNYYVA